MSGEESPTTSEDDEHWTGEDTEVVANWQNLPNVVGADKPEGPSKNEKTQRSAYFTYSKYATALLLWSVLYIVFIKLRFGMVYLLVSALLAVYFSTRTEPRRMEELSPYSVFNRGFFDMRDVRQLREFISQVEFYQWMYR